MKTNNVLAIGIQRIISAPDNFLTDIVKQNKKCKHILTLHKTPVKWNLYTDLEVEVFQCDLLVQEEMPTLDHFSPQWKFYGSEPPILLI